MSLVGRNHAFIGLGISCQTARQLRSQSGLLSSIAGEPLTEQSSFLNWVYISASEIGSVVERLMAAPITVASIHVPAKGRGALMLEDYKLWFWHEKTSDAVSMDDVAHIAAKYEHLRRSFLGMLEKPARYLVLSNTQNNADQHYPHLEQGMDIHFDSGIVRGIAESGWAANRHGRAETVVITCPWRWRGPPHPSIAFLPRDTSEWSGNIGNWEKLLRQRLAFAGRDDRGGVPPGQARNEGQ